MRLLMSSMVLCVAVGACERRADQSGSSNDARRNQQTSGTSGAGTTGTTGMSTSTTSAADNTAKNRVDATSPTRTPMDQSNSKSDIDITASIRRAIMDDSTMSMNAQNCKIITEGGVTTLRGPVASQAEKDAIEEKAKAVAGVTRVDNQLEVKAK